MVKNINETFTNEEHREMLKQKEELRKELNVKRLSWRDFILYKLGIRKHEDN